MRKGQLLWIDAQCDGDAVSYCYLVAYWDDEFKTTEGVGTIKYDLQNATSSWESFYEHAVNVIKFLQPKNVISITGSTSVPPVTVLFVFYYEDAPAASQDIRHCAVEKLSWESAATHIIYELESKGAKAGQLIGIDAHNNLKEGSGRFAAFWNASLPALGDLRKDDYLKRVSKNDMDSWADQYEFARNHIQNVNYSHPIAVFGATSCVNMSTASTAVSWFTYGLISAAGNGVTNVFYAEDKVSKVELDKEKMEEKNFVADTQDKRFVNANSTAIEQKWMTSEEKTATTSSVFNFTHKEGVTLTPNATFTFGLPEGAEAALGLSLAFTKELTWQQTDSVMKSVTNKNTYEESFIIPPEHVAVCRVYTDRTELTAPYTMTFKSGRTSTGTWTGKKDVVNMLPVFFPINTSGISLFFYLSNKYFRYFTIFLSFQ